MKKYYNQIMKSTNEILAATGLTYPMLNRLKDLGIVPKPRLKGQGRRKGVVGVFEDSVIDIINRVKLQKKRGLTLIQIAEKIRQERELLGKVEPHGRVIIPETPGAMSNYIRAMPELYEQIERENPGYRLHTIRMVSVVSKEKRYLVPVEIVIVPI